MSGRRNVIGGKGYKKRGNNTNFNREVKIDLDNGNYDYAIVIKSMGNNQIQIKLINGDEMTAYLPGKFYKKRRYVKIDVLLIINLDTNPAEVVKIITDPNEDSEIRKNFKFVDKNNIKEQEDTGFDFDVL